MSRRASTIMAWFGTTFALVALISLVRSPQVRYQLASAGERLGEIVDRGLKRFQSGMHPGFGKQMAALEEISQTLDTATTQWEASMTVSKVAAAMAEEPQLRGRNVGVRMIGGILHLEGEVRSDREKELAGEIARRASGAELVANDLKVVSSIT